MFETTPFVKTNSNRYIKLLFHAHLFYDHGLQGLVLAVGFNLPDGVHHFLAGNNLAENRVIIGQRIVLEHNEKLAAVGVGAGVGHGHDALLVAGLV